MKLSDYLNRKLSLKLLMIVFGYFVFIETNAQTMHDSWMRGQTSWRTDIGISIGPTTGIQFQYFTPRRNTCKTLNKRIGFDFGVYYEGLIFSNDLKTKLPNWEKGGYRGNISLLVFPDLRIKANRFFIGGGIESGTRKISGDQIFQTDFIAKVGWELSFLSLTGTPVILRISLKYDKCLNNEFTYLLPTVGLIFGK